jgi:hypothetical protein
MTSSFESSWLTTSGTQPLRSWSIRIIYPSPHHLLGCPSTNALVEVDQAGKAKALMVSFSPTFSGRLVSSEFIFLVDRHASPLLSRLMFVALLAND